jgi:hypothetical protein
MKKFESIKYKRIIPIYNVPLCIVICNSITEALHKYFNDYNDVQYNALCCKRNHNLWLFFDEKYLTNYYIGHEVFHATNKILEHIGYEYSKIENDEFVAYLNGYILDCVMKIIKKFKNKKRYNG